LVRLALVMSYTVNLLVVVEWKKMDATQSRPGLVNG
jgi:hypothetical protein